jgi:hypothetical protein
MPRSSEVDMAGVLGQRNFACRHCFSPSDGHFVRDKIVIYPAIDMMHIMVALQSLYAPASPPLAHRPPYAVLLRGMLFSCAAITP